jgi:hypothetical protein
MPRRARHTPPGLINNVLIRGVGRQPLFHKAEDDAAFGRPAFESSRFLPEGNWGNARGEMRTMGDER